VVSVWTVGFWALLVWLAFGSIRFVVLRLIALFAWLIVVGMGCLISIAAQPLWVVFALLWPASRLSRRELAPGLPGVVKETSEDGQPLGSEGMEGATEFRTVPLSAHLCARPRRRAVWVRRLEVVLGVPSGYVGRLVAGRWTPDLPCAEYSAGANLVLSHFETGAKILGGGLVHGASRGEGDPVRSAYVVVELADGSTDVVFPELVGALASYSILRDRDATLVSSLRLRALEWCKGAGLSKSATFLAVPAAIRFAWQVSPAERRLRESLAGGPSPPLWWSSA
jgi:hypothetical protein